MQAKRKKIKSSLIIVLIFLYPFIIYAPMLFGGVFIAPGDGLLVLSSTIFESHSILNGEFPLWDGFVGVGSPFLADPGNAALYPLKALALFLPPVIYSTVFYIISVGLAGLFMYLFIREETKNERIATIVAFVLMSSSIIGGYRKAHIAVYSTIIWLPLILFFLRRYASTRERRFLVLSAAFMTIQFFAGNAQYFAYSTATAYLFFIFVCREKYRIREILRDVGILSIFLLGFSAVQLLPTLDFLVTNKRGAADYMSLYSTNPSILTMVLFPEIYGDIFAPFGTGSAELSIELYIGVVPLLYLCYALYHCRKKKEIRFFSIISVIALLYASSIQLGLLPIIERIPVLNMFGVPSRALFLFVFAGLYGFAVGMNDIFSSDELEKPHVFFRRAWVLISVSALFAFAVGTSETSIQLRDYFREKWFLIFGVSIVISGINYVVIGIVKRSQKQRNRALFRRLSAILLCVITMIDLGRYSYMTGKGDYNEAVYTEEIQALRLLPDIGASRVAAVWAKNDGFYGSLYGASGLVDNRSKINSIRNLNGWVEFENQALDTMLGKIESRDGSYVRLLLAMKPDLLSMLSLKYILFPKDVKPLGIDNNAEPSIVYENSSSYVVPGNGELTVFSFPVELVEGRFYSIEFDLDAPEGLDDVRAFYIDFYGGPEYDSDEQQRGIREDGKQSYILYAGNMLPDGEKFMRFVAISDSESDISFRNIRLSLLGDGSVEGLESSFLVPIANTEKYTIYENKRAQGLLFIPEEIRAIEDQLSLVNDPYRYDNLDTIAYVEGIQDEVIRGELSNIVITNNQLSADVYSDEGTFVVHSQSFLLGWKAYVDGIETKVYAVNGVIQGAYVPPGNHQIIFRYAPAIVYISASISMAFVFATIMVWALAKWKRRRRELL